MVEERTLHRFTYLAGQDLPELERVTSERQLFHCSLDGEIDGRTQSGKVMPSAHQD